MDNKQVNKFSDRYVPFNLSSVAPFESMARALAELPVLHTTAPSVPLEKLPDDALLSSQPSEEVSARMTEMLEEAAVYG